MTLRVIALVVFLSACIASQSAAQPTITGRSVGLGESGALGMTGISSIGWNPANLGLSYNPPGSYFLPSFGMVFGNNAYSPRFLSDIFVEGKHLEQADKDRVVEQMTKDRLDLFIRGNFPIIGGSFGNYAINLFNFHAVGMGTIPADLFKLAFTGGDSGVVYNFNDIAQEGMVYWTGSLSAAQIFQPNEKFSELAAGATFKYIRGISYGGIQKWEGYYQVTADTIHAEGRLLYLNSFGGDGVGLDLGVAGRYEPWGMYFGLTLGNILGSIGWSEGIAEIDTFNLHRGLDLDSVGTKEYWDNLFRFNRTVERRSGPRTPLQRYIVLSAAKHGLLWRGRGDLYFTWMQGLNTAFGMSTTPKLSIGHDFRAQDWLKVRTGLGIGGREGSIFAAGLGFDLGYYQIEIGGSWQRGFANSAKGFSLAFTNYIELERPPKTE